MKITDVGNYALPVFGAIVTVALSLSPTVEQPVILSFCLYVIVATCISYMHRLSYLRYRKNQESRDEEPTHLPISMVCMFLFLHISCISFLIYKLVTLGVL